LIVHLVAGRSTIDPSSSASPFGATRDPPFGGSYDERDCPTSMREKLTDAWTDEFIDPAKTNLWR
jgi:hypothetical protein